MQQQARWGHDRQHGHQDVLHALGTADDLGLSGGQAVAALHDANVAHMDLRPEHVFVAQEAGSCSTLRRHASWALQVHIMGYSQANVFGCLRHTPEQSQALHNTSPLSAA